VSNVQGVTAAELRQLRVDNLDVDDGRTTIFVDKHGPRIARRVPIDAFAGDVLRAYIDARRALHCPTQWLFIADESPRLLRNTFGRRHLIAGKPTSR
jgi:integrase